MKVGNDNKLDFLDLKRKIAERKINFYVYSTVH